MSYENQDFDEVNKTITVQATNWERTHDTAMHELKDLYCGLNPEEIQELIHTKPLEDDRIIYMSPKANCKMLGYVMDHSQNSEN